MNSRKNSKSCIEKNREFHIKSNLVLKESLKTNCRKENETVHKHAGLCIEMITQVNITSNHVMTECIKTNGIEENTAGCKNGDSLMERLRKSFYL